MALYWIEGLRSTGQLIRRTWSDDERERTTSRFKVVLGTLVFVTTVPVMALIVLVMNDVMREAPLKVGATLLALVLTYPFSALIERTMYADETREALWLDLAPSGRSTIQRSLFHHMAILAIYTALGASVVALQDKDEISTAVAAGALSALFVVHVGAAALVSAQGARIWRPSPESASRFRFDR